MCIERLKTHSKDFVILYKQVINDKKLSLKSIGLWVYLMGLPDDWTINAKDLANRHRDGYESNLSALNELQENGYAYKRKKETLNKGKDGKFSKGGWVIFEQKTDLEAFEKKLIEDMNKEKPYTENPDTVNPCTVKPELLSNERISTEKESIDKERKIKERKGVNPPSASPPPPSPLPDKKKDSDFIKPADHVCLRKEEHEKLLGKFGEVMVKRYYDELSAWKKDKPKSKWRKNDYMSILRWVVDCIKERDLKKKRLEDLDNKNFKSKNYGKNNGNNDKLGEEKREIRVHIPEDARKNYDKKVKNGEKYKGSIE